MSYSGLIPIRHTIAQAVTLLGEYPFQGKEDLVRLLCLLEVEPDQARDLVTFVPLAYFRVLLRKSGARFSDFYIVRDDSGETRTVPFAENDLYQEAVRVAEEHLASGLPIEELEPVILRSCEFEEVNGLLAAGVEPAAIEVNPPQIGTDGDEGDELPPAEELSKQWWEFWK